MGGLGATRSLQGFPQVHGFLDYQLAAAILQSLLLGGVSAGIATALDIEGGFFDRLVASPTPRAALVLGRVLAGGVIATVQVTYFLVLGFVFGAQIQGGVVGALCIYAIAIVAGTGFGAIGVLIALRSRSASTVQGIFPLVFVVLFISSALSFIANGMRQPIAFSNQLGPILDGLLAAAGVSVAAIGLSIAALRGKLRSA